MVPPKEVGPRTEPGGADNITHTTTSNHHEADGTVDSSGDPRQAVHDVLAGMRRRREAALRSEGGDPETNARRFHRLTSGLMDCGYRFGFGRGGCDALRRVWPYVAPEHRGEIARIAAEYRAGEDD